MSLLSFLRSLPLRAERRRLESRGVVILDDLHKASYHEEARRRLQESKSRFFDLSSYTLDDYGRYAWLVDFGSTSSDRG